MPRFLPLFLLLCTALAPHPRPSWGQVPDAFADLPSGTMSLELPDSSAGAAGNWSSEVSLPEPLTSAWLLEQTPVVRFSDLPERPR